MGFSEFVLLIVNLLHCVLRAFPDTLAALDAESVINYGETVGILGDSADGACFDQRTNVVVGADIFVYSYHW